MTVRCISVHSNGERCSLELGHTGYCQLDPTVHRCHAKYCMTPVKPELLMCSRHWRALPKHLQTAVWDTYRPGQCDDKNPSSAWHKAADAAIQFIANLERTSAC